MKGLILDTSTQKALVGLADGNTLAQVKEIAAGRSLSSGLFPAIEPLCDGIEYIAVGVGPGSYMGVRTGATVAKLLAFARNIPLIEFSSILVSIPSDQTGPFLFVGDAKMGEDFIVSGEIQDGRATITSSPQLIPQGEANQHLSPSQTLILAGQTPPHLQWVFAHALDALSQKKTILSGDLSLSYIR